ncbi:hypothetical protein AV530_001318 [Patagioenas fasciata monilis]|uniref:Uncharacterized protein n=1 Tax=Patagioenas fasciata monilis TaxID=372326 RepID=A0A1V4JQL5_PATFA|nr:hypothetical protein AV530_001318 [Patagioenas fasciata monilis]
MRGRSSLRRVPPEPSVTSLCYDLYLAGVCDCVVEAQFARQTSLQGSEVPQLSNAEQLTESHRCHKCDQGK